MKKLFLNFALATCIITGYGQEHQIRQLERQIASHPQPDTFRVNRLNTLAQISSLSAGKADTLATEALSIAQKLNYAQGQGFALVNKGLAAIKFGKRDQVPSILQQVNLIAKKTGDQELWARYWYLTAGFHAQHDNQKSLAAAFKADSLANKLPDKQFDAFLKGYIARIYANSLSNYPKAMDWLLKSIKVAEDHNQQNELAQGWSALAGYYTVMGDNKNGLLYYRKALEANKTLDNKDLSFRLYNNIGERYRLMGNYPEALRNYNHQLALTGLTPYITELCESNMADVYVRTGGLQMAFKYAFRSLKMAEGIDDTEGVAWIDGILSRAYSKDNKPDSAVYYGNRGLAAAKKTGTIEFMRDNYGALANAYAQKKDFDQAYKYQGLFVAYRDSMVNSEVSNKASLLQYNFDLAKKQAQITSLNQESKMQYYFLAGSVAMLLIIGATGVILFKNNRQKQKANLLLSKQKKEIEQQRDQTNKALNELQQTQTQLIQREKMASLGELTAGIAHEIQNPLNFVNNFSEVNKEMLEELKAESKKPKAKRDEQVELELINDLIENEQKINHHGKRADAIVKGMLQHSQSHSAAKEPTNINTLADEYMRLSYHGLRSKDKSFNAEMITHFDEKVPQINVIPQDIGRVLLNLFNNAFYAVNKKQRTAGADYKPEVTVTTYAEKGQVIIIVKDNGIGIPDTIKDKIMQPFFTTKPTGEGTGLGLSLSYDMVVKGHGGSINVDTREGEFTEFTISFPIA